MCSEFWADGDLFGHSGAVLGDCAALGLAGWDGRTEREVPSQKKHFRPSPSSNKMNLVTERLGQLC